MMGADTFKGEGMNIPHLVAGEKSWPPVLVLARRIPVSIILVLHALQAQRLFGLWSPQPKSGHAEDKRACDLFSDTGGSLSNSWTQESDLKLALSLETSRWQAFCHTNSMYLNIK